MRITEKIQLIENIATMLQQKYTFADIDVFLAEFQVNNVSPKGYISKRLYVKERLNNIKETELIRIADVLEIATDNLIKNPPKNWVGTDSAKAFICHVAKDKSIAKRLRDVLKGFNIEAFVAHEDIKPSEQWQIEIERALKTMDIFISIHTEGFSESIWCQQEIGYASCRGVKIIPIKFDENPQGFIGKIQALIRGKKQAEEVTFDILEILKNDEKYTPTHCQDRKQANLRWIHRRLLQQLGRREPEGRPEYQLLRSMPRRGCDTPMPDETADYYKTQNTGQDHISP